MIRKGAEEIGCELRLSLGRVSGTGDTDVCFRLTVEDTASSTHVMEVMLDAEGFANLMSTREARCRSRIWWSGLIGCRSQNLSIDVPLTGSEYDGDRGPKLPSRVLRAAEAMAEKQNHRDDAPWEADSAGWNGHRLKRGRDGVNTHEVIVRRWLPRGEMP